MEGFIHSTESFGTVDGPGVRFVIFFQGCPMRCKYCHNPDTWQPGKGTRRSVGSLLEEFGRNRDFYARGGITVTGGEPLLQPDFLLELFREAKKQKIHTCLDTSGITYTPGDTAYNRKLDEILAVTDLVMLDLKHSETNAHKELTGHGNEGILAFAALLARKQIPVWVRHVVVPGITDEPGQLLALGGIIAQLPNVQALDVLPYHTMGVRKYAELGLPYPLEGVPSADQQLAKQAKQQILRGMQLYRARKKG